MLVYDLLNTHWSYLKRNIKKLQGWRNSIEIKNAFLSKLCLLIEVALIANWLAINKNEHFVYTSYEYQALHRFKYVEFQYFMSNGSTCSCYRGSYTLLAFEKTSIVQVFLMNSNSFLIACKSFLTNSCLFLVCHFNKF